MSLYQNMLARYEAGELPWHDALPPPEIMTFVPTLPIGRAIDLGCGPGRTAIYLASLGWQVDGIDFIPKAIEMAKAAAAKAAAAKAADVAPQFHVASVLELDFLAGPYNLAVDVGCCHAMSADELGIYQQHLKRLLQPGGYFLLFARLQGNEPLPEDGPRGMDEAILKTTFADGFTLEKQVNGLTQITEAPAWRSGWFWFLRI
jgi:SAM-dependent methyltransferase